MNGATVLITGGTGSFGRHFTRALLDTTVSKIIIYSRDEYKQSEMRKTFDDPRMRYFIGDVRDAERLRRACYNVDYIVHAAALKQVPSCEYNPFEAVKTNVYGAQNVCDVAIDSGVEKVVALSTDKAVNPINLYGATKLCSDKLIIGANAYSGGSTKFCLVRYGNVAGSRGSVVPLFRELAGKGEIPITDFRMTRFWISLDEAVSLVFLALAHGRGGETYIAKIPSFSVVDLARAIAPNAMLREVGIRPGEKLHEVMITENDLCYAADGHYVVYPPYDWAGQEHAGCPMGEFRYASDTNEDWLSVEELAQRAESL